MVISNNLSPWLTVLSYYLALQWWMKNIWHDYQYHHLTQNFISDNKIESSDLKGVWFQGDSFYQLLLMQCDWMAFYKITANVRGLKMLERAFLTYHRPWKSLKKYPKRLRSNNTYTQLFTSVTDKLFVTEDEIWNSLYR